MIQSQPFTQSALQENQQPAFIPNTAGSAQESAPNSAPILCVWLYSVGVDDFVGQINFSASLASAGIRVDPPNTSLSECTGLVLFDRVSPELIEFVRARSQAGRPHILAIAASRSALPAADAWRLLQCGVSDVVAWDELADPAGMIAARLRRWREVDALMASPLVQDNLIGRSRAWTSVLSQIVEVARFSDAPILLTGETGTGKELVAQLVHALSPNRCARELVILDCTTIVPELSGSELFGHERGAFTGAVASRDGALALAHGGTLFLDEVGELPLAQQAQLLRAVQERTYKRVGGNAWHDTDFRLVCATNRDLLREEADGRFRRDLYYRIASWSFKLPPLRERAEDIIPLARCFMQQQMSEPELDPPELDEPVREYLLARPYPGNVRDLRNLAFRIMHRHVGPGPITIGDIPADERLAGEDASGWRNDDLDQVIRRALISGAGLKEIRAAAEDTAVRIAVDDEDGNLQRAARRLGVTDRALQMRRAEQRKLNQMDQASET